MPLDLGYRGSLGEMGFYDDALWRGFASDPFK